MLKCKKCGGFLYEEEVYYDEDDNKIVQIGCYQCSHKAYIKAKDWAFFKKKINDAIKKNNE